MRCVQRLPIGDDFAATTVFHVMEGTAEEWATSRRQAPPPEKNLVGTDPPKRRNLRLANYVVDGGQCHPAVSFKHEVDFNDCLELCTASPQNNLVGMGLARRSNLAELWCPRKRKAMASWRCTASTTTLDYPACRLIGDASSHPLVLDKGLPAGASLLYFDSATQPLKHRFTGGFTLT